MLKIVVMDGYALNPGDLNWDGLRELGSVEIFERTPETLILPRARSAEAVLTNKTPLSGETMEQLPHLEYIGVLATGYNIVDVQAATARGITVTNIPEYGTASVAQFTIALLLELCLKITAHSHAVRMGEWADSPDWSFYKSPLIELSGKTMGIVGFGRIGRQTGAIAHALGMRVIAADSVQSNAPAWPGFAWRTVEELLAESDVVTLHCPLTSDTKGLIDARRLALMKPAAFLINTSRGPLIVETDLADALNEDRLAGAALDVLSTEPPERGNHLFTSRNCVITPHIAWATKEARGRLMEMAVGNLAAYLKGEPCNSVNEAAWSVKSGR